MTITLDSKRVRTLPTNPNHRYYNFRVPIEGHFIWERRSGCTLNAADGHPTIESIKMIPGVDHFMLNSAYQIGLSRAEMYGWEEIEPELIRILVMHDNIGGGQ